MKSKAVDLWLKWKNKKLTIKIREVFYDANKAVFRNAVKTDSFLNFYQFFTVSWIHFNPFFLWPSSLHFSSFYCHNPPITRPLHICLPWLSIFLFPSSHTPSSNPSGVKAWGWGEGAGICLSLTDRPWVQTFPQPLTLSGAAVGRVEWQLAFPGCTSHQRRLPELCVFACLDIIETRPFW